MDSILKDELMNIVIVGHVDHGKSTVIGRLLADTGSLPSGKLEQIKEMCRRNAKPFEYAFLLDALKDERSQGITIDTARCFFKTEKRKYIVIDAPGHIEFLKNMITGASRADAALLVIDAAEGVQENSRRHGYMLSMLGIRQVCVLVNKMDLVNYDQSVFEQVKKEYDEFLSQIGITPEGYIPVSGMQGDNIAAPGDRMDWYHGPTVLETLDRFIATAPPISLPFRMPVQDVYKFTGEGDDRRIIAGTVETGKLTAGDELVFYPSGKKTTVKRIEPMTALEKDGIAEAGYATGFTMAEQIYIRRGELCTRADEPAPLVGNLVKVSLFWLGNTPMTSGKSYYLKTGSAKVECHLEETLSVMDASTLKRVKKERVDKYDVAECILSTERLVAFDNVGELAVTGRFVIVDEYEISGGGIFTDTVQSRHLGTKRKLELRDIKWEKSAVSVEERKKRFGQTPAIILITGAEHTDKKTPAKALEKSLFDSGKNAYYLGIGSVLYGMNADLNPSNREKRSSEHIRRLAEVANILTDTGLILVVTATELSKYDVETIKLVSAGKPVLTVWLGDPHNTDLVCDMVLDEHSPDISQKIVEKLKTDGMI
ncbi:MAG TPA: GTP-binding protein [Oscillospiraceae bacterium]|nr:GTP-binding protein [Oscillospiraceae bacterium]HPK36343.1 GTP-binding protein [Oscillospiraceae bacterium]HPR76694.1 GTP-binding protein [Oscillospiraceae bacterium]